MFEKPPIWVIVVGLNVCVLIWLITVQEPVMYDASTSLISSGSNNNFGGGGGGGVAANVAPLQRVGRDDRDIKDEPAQYSGKYLPHDITSTLTTLNLSSSSLNSVDRQPITLQKRTDETIKTTTDAIDRSADMHSLTSSLGTGVLEAKFRPTPSWIKLTAVSSALPDEDFNQLIDLHDFHYLVPQPVCSADVEALILVHSAPRNHEKRQIIRDTWASIGRHIIDAPLRVFFLLGSVADEQLQQNILTENAGFGDVIQGSFVDDYRNMTYKHVMAFKWFLYNCPQAQILIKVDDDVYVNTPLLIKYLKEEQLGEQQRLQKLELLQNQKPQLEKNQKQQDKEQEDDNPTIITINDTPKTTKSTKKAIYDSLRNIANTLTYSSSASESASASSSSSTSTHNFTAATQLFHHPQNLLFCQKLIGSLVKRSYRSKWRVSFKEYRERYYPPYCPGYAIIYSPDVVFRLYTAAQKFKYFWIDDVHITGVLAQQTNTTITTSSHYVLYSDECERLLTGKTDLKDTEFLFAWHSISGQQIKAIWNLQMMSLRTLADLHYKKRRREHEQARLVYNTSNYLPAEGLR